MTEQQKPTIVTAVLPESLHLLGDRTNDFTVINTDFGWSIVLSNYRGFTIDLSVYRYDADSLWPQPNDAFRFKVYPLHQHMRTIESVLELHTQPIMIDIEAMFQKGREIIDARMAKMETAGISDE